MLNVLMEEPTMFLGSVPASAHEPFCEDFASCVVALIYFVAPPDKSHPV